MPAPLDASKHRARERAIFIGRMAAVTSCPGNRSIAQMSLEPELEELEKIEKESRDSIKRVREMAETENAREGTEAYEPPIFKPKD